MNKDEATREEQVLRYLQQHANTWVDGPDLANERVGGSEGLKRLRELRDKGHRIVKRPHPNASRDIYQYKLVVPEQIHPQVIEAIRRVPVDPIANQAEIERALPKKQKPFPLSYDEKRGEYSVAGEVCVECEGIYYDEAAHRQSKQHTDWIKRRTQMFADRPEQTEVPVDPQPPIFKYDKMPEKFALGDAVVCPRCQGHKRKYTERFNRKKGQIVVTEGEDFTRDPYKPTAKSGEPNRCPRCNGFGVVPNLGGV